MRSTLVFAACAAIAVAAAATPADARPRPGHQRHFESNKSLGLGLELGAPFGLSGKYFLKEGGDRAIDFGIGDIGPGYYGDRSGIHLYADYLWHPLSLTGNETFELPLFIGIGGRYWDFDYGKTSGAYAVGVRVPVGIAFDFNNVPFDIFIQVAFVLDFVHNYTHDVYGDADFSLGARFWF